MNCQILIGRIGIDKQHAHLDLHHRLDPFSDSQQQRLRVFVLPEGGKIRHIAREKHEFLVCVLPGPFLRVFSQSERREIYRFQSLQHGAEFWGIKGKGVFRLRDVQQVFRYHVVQQFVFLGLLGRIHLKRNHVRMFFQKRRQAIPQKREIFRPGSRHILRGQPQLFHRLGIVEAAICGHIRGNRHQLSVLKQRILHKGIEALCQIGQRLALRQVSHISTIENSVILRTADIQAVNIDLVRSVQHCLQNVFHILRHQHFDFAMLIAKIKIGGFHGVHVVVLHDQARLRALVGVRGALHDRLIIHGHEILFLG